MIETEFSHVYQLLSKQGSTLNIEHGDLHLKLINLQPNIHKYSPQCTPNFFFPLNNNSRIKGVFASKVYSFFSRVDYIKHW